ncbi:diacylglycerol kinase family lipid kinase [Flavobacteriales bacterium]|jgi:diacylglycerol kinase (ATP)|nr:diacylglycerol kinase family lipid kinase [Flavobacteriales bacterium]
MKIRFIVNPISGNGNHHSIENLIKEHLDLKKFHFDCRFTKRPKHATELAQQATTEGIDVVVAVGGDGTMHECAKGLLGSETALAVLPCGSGNGFALHFGMSKELSHSIQQLNTSGFITIDSCTANGLPFFNVSGVGFDAHIANLFATTKVRGFLTYVKLVLRECAFYPAQDYTLEYDGRKEIHNAVIISWANATQFGNNAQISPESKVDDGMVDICILKDFRRYKVPFLIYRLFKESIHLSKYMTIIRTKRVKISCQNGQSHLDGERIDLGKEIEIDTHPKTLKVFVPNG